MAITSVGYDGTVSEVQWAKMIPSVGSSTYGVAGVSDWKASVHPSIDRGINIAAGVGYGYGIYDTSDSVVTVTGATISSGSRYDMVVARRDWTGAGGATTFRIISGTSSRTMPNRTKTPGSVDEQPIALVRYVAGQTKAAEIIDLRTWTGPGGAMAVDEMALGYLNEPGARIVINGDDWLCTISGGSPTWVKNYTFGRLPIAGFTAPLFGAKPTNGQLFQIQAGTVVAKSDASGFSRISWPQPFPNGLLTLTLQSGDEFNNGTGSTFAPSGWSAMWGDASTGNKTEVVYVYQAASGQRLPNRTHRVNFIAIGW